MNNSASNTALPAYVSARQGAALLDVSVAFFRQNVASRIPAVDLAPEGARKRLPRWSVDALLRWAASQNRAA